VSTTHETDGVRVRARLAEASVGRLSEFVVSGGIDPTPTGNI